MGFKSTTGTSHVSTSYLSLLEFPGRSYRRLLQLFLFLVDFCVTREYTKEFMDSWLCLLQAAGSEDCIACTEWSQKLG
jgi:hypothetical protein